MKHQLRMVHLGKILKESNVMIKTRELVAMYFIRKV